MMVNRQKRKGTDWERQLVELLKEFIPDSDVKRIPGSGAIGTILDEPGLSGDVVAKFSGIPAKFRIEAKTGYGGKKQMTIQREWLTKIKSEAESNFEYPALAGKFLGARESEGVQYFIVLDLNTFCDIINMISYYSDELDARDE